MKKKIFILLLFFAIVAAWSRFISTKGLIIKEYAIENSKIPKSFDGIKIVHFSDLHYGSTAFKKELANIVNKINEYNPEIVVFTGDLSDLNYKLSEDDKKTLTKELSKIDAKIAKYAVSGNHDYDYNGYESIMTNAGFKIMHNKSEKVFYKSNESITIKGIPSYLRDKPNVDSIFSEEDGNYTILLLHEPDAILDIRKYNVDLALAGHSHGGQIRLPFIGALIATKGGEKYYDEYYKVDETDFYISSGIGTSGFKFRFFDKPSINVYRLYKK